MAMGVFTPSLTNYCKVYGKTSGKKTPVVHKEFSSASALCEIMSRYAPFFVAEGPVLEFCRTAQPYLKGAADILIFPKLLCTAEECAQQLFNPDDVQGDHTKLTLWAETVRKISDLLADSAGAMQYFQVVFRVGPVSYGDIASLVKDSMDIWEGIRIRRHAALSVHPEQVRKQSSGWHKILKGSVHVVIIVSKIAITIFALMLFPPGLSILVSVIVINIERSKPFLSVVYGFLTIQDTIYDDMTKAIYG